MQWTKQAIVILVMMGSIIFPSFALADNYGIDDTQKATGGLLPTTIASQSSIPGVIGKVVAVGLSLIGILFFLLVLYAGFRWMIARGNTEDVTKAKDILEAAAIGLVLVLAAYAISSFVFTSLGAGDGGTKSAPVVAGNKCEGKSSDDVCDLNSTCQFVNGQITCQSNCERDRGKCGPAANCATKIEKNLCPGGGDNVCCKS